MRKAAGKRKRKSDEGLLQTCPDIAQISFVYIPLAELSHIAKHSSRDVGKCRFILGGHAQLNSEVNLLTKKIMITG